ncbi:hypothetical protein AAMO2058_001465500 [Amorphochlora amoebiformis]
MAVEGRSGGSDRGKPNPAAGFRVTRKRSRGSHSGISFTTAFTVIVTARLISAATNPIADCDESFNYWEPLHFLIYGWGMQTWEYDPRYALRSYLYLFLHAAFGHLSALLGVEASLGRRGVFYAIRGMLGVLSAVADAAFASKVATRFGPGVSRATTLCLAVSAGLFNSGASFLPQTFAREMVTFSFVAWYSKSDMMAIFAMGLASLVGWPFCVLVGAGIGLEILRRRGVIFCMVTGVISLATIAGCLVAVDSALYGRTVLAPVNIAVYNSRIDEGEKGGTLYGVEPWDFFFKNLTLNFSALVPLAFALPATYFLSKMVGASEDVGYGLGPIMAVGGPFWAWFGLMSCMPHKEERFMYVCYPLLCLTGSIGLEVLCAVCGRLAMVLFGCGKGIARQIKTLGWILGLAVITACSMSRSFAMVHSYSAPLHAYAALTNYHAQLSPKLPPRSGGNTYNVCVGKEWYRFPSHFLLDDKSLRLAFLKSGFDGQLPQMYLEMPSVLDATSAVRDHFNDMNREEPTRYTSENECDYVVDLELSDQKEKEWSEQEGWKIVADLPFLDASKSPSLSRAFYIPGYSAYRNMWARYLVFARET